MLLPKDYIGPLMELAQERRGEFKEMKYITEIRASLTYELPLAEVVSLFVWLSCKLQMGNQMLGWVLQMVGDFFDQLKSRSKGYASMEYNVIGYAES